CARSYYGAIGDYW
nr:immunoglobulin heavy chain junction region [Macaca mulatta]MOW90965.1 immunoglobulin heavy chain junction region [Macaca mulatta]MOW91631.1 immunoglobulin heavy chain junction region [Macaca mulatta]MOW92968.1 immunoglobulin heavy chain junction region [Macaca mulatta]